MATIWNYKTMLFRQGCILLIATTFFKRSLSFLVIYIRYTLKIEDRCYIIFEVILTHRTTQYVACLKQEVVQILHAFHFKGFLVFGNQRFFFIFLFYHNILLSYEDRELFCRVKKLFYIYIEYSSYFSECCHIGLGSISTPFRNGCRVFA